MEKKLSNNIEQNEENFEIKQNNVSFDEEEYSSWLSEVDERKVEQKEIDKSKAEELKKDLDDELLSEENKKLILDIIWEEEIIESALKELSELTTKDLKNIIENKKFILEITNDKNISLWDLIWYGKKMSELTKQELEHIKKICEWEMVDIEKIVTLGKLIKNINKDFIKRKINYLDKCRKNDSQLINDSEFEELFWKEWKFWKWEINQGKLWYCYFYTVCEMLKKTNYFNILVKTNLRKSKTWEWWDIRLPMWHADWQWIPVSKDEIDKTFDVPNKKLWLKKWVSVNSDTQLWFKIIEIGFIKKALMSLDKDIEKEFLDTWDIKLTWEKIAMLEGDALVTALSLGKYYRSQNSFVLETLIWKEHFDGWYNHLFYEWDENLIFNCFNLWLLVDTSVKTSKIEDAEIKMDVDWKMTDSILLRDVKIINKDEDISEIKPGIIKNKDGIFERLTREKRTKEMLLDFVIDENGPWVVFSRGHAYSVERCYVDKNWNKRVWVVNPYHTWIKFDMSFENAKKIFDWEVSFIDTDKLFR